MKEFVFKVGERQYVFTMNQNITKQVTICSVNNLHNPNLTKKDAIFNILSFSQNFPKYATP
jgi:hypothetical protein